MMASKAPTRAVLAAPQEALAIYLDALLAEVANADEMPEPGQGDAAPPSTAVVTPAADPDSPDVPGAASADETGAQAEPSPSPASQEAKTPPWAQTAIQCLTFQVAGVTLAAPLEKLHGIIEWHAELTEIPGSAAWFMGLLPNRGQNVQVVDTAQIIMPDGRQPDARPVLERMKYVVLIAEGRWGLAVDKISQVLNLEPQAVRWRGDGGRRPWLAGTAVEQMCALLDIDSLAEQLRHGFGPEAG